VWIFPDEFKAALEMNPVLATDSVIKCPHGGTAYLTTSNAVFSINGKAVLIETDVHTVINCFHHIATLFSPCVKIRWSGGATKLLIGGTPVLIKSSIGDCLNTQNHVQGTAVITLTQTKVKTQ
jgi:hypothetical protein